MGKAHDGEQDRVGHGVLEPQEGEDEHGHDHGHDLGPVVVDEPVVDEEHRQVDHEVAQDGPHKEVPHPGDRVHVGQLGLHGVDGLLPGGASHQGGETVHDGEDEPAQEVAHKAHEQDPHAPPRGNTLVVAADDHHHHIGGQELGLGVVDEYQGRSEREGAEKLPHPRRP